jgi:alpha-mannosidase
MHLAALQRLHDTSRMRQLAGWQRLAAQLEFAEFLVARHPGEGRFAPALDAARQAAAQAATAVVPDLGAATAAIETMLAPLAARAKSYTVYLVGHAHIDMNWMWSWPETVSTTLDTFRTMLELLREFPEFRFSQSQAGVYRLTEKYAPELLPEIAAAVKAGRWEVTASHWVECDKNMVGGEALCRHLLYTRRYLQTLFGLEAEDVPVDWSPDTFGHPATVPTCLAGGGVKYLYLHRPGNLQQPVPETFWWEAPDGSRVLVHNAQRRGYNGEISPRFVLDALRAAGQSAAPLDYALIAYGVGDHGGGPTRRDLLLRREMETWPVFPRLLCAAGGDYFARLACEGDRLPVLRGELNFEVAGCYTSQTLIKRANRLAEARLADAETAAVLDSLARGAEYPRAALERGWRRTLFSHFHDILPGSCVHDARTYTHGLFQETMAATQTVTTRALRGVAGEVDTARVTRPIPGTALPTPAFFTASGHGSGAGIGAAEGRLSLYSAHLDSPLRPFVVFNLTTVPRREVVTLTIWDREPCASPTPFHDKLFEVVDAAGQTLAAQVLAKGGLWGHRNITLAVPVDLPPLGYTTLVVRETFAPPAAEPGAWQLAKPYHCSYVPRERARLGLENAFLRVRFDMRTGRVVSLFDKRAGLEMLDAGGGGIGLEYGVERPHGMTAWCIGNAGPAEMPVVRSMRETRAGPHSAAVEVVYAIRESTARATYRLDRDDPRLHLGLDVDWCQRGTPESGCPNLRLAIPLAFADPGATYEIPFGAVARATPPDQEVPALRWAGIGGRIGGARAALLLLNDCKHGHALDGATLRVNLIRSSYDPDPFPEIGRHAMAFALMPVDSEISAAQATRLAQAFVSPPVTVATGVHPGRLAPARTLLTVSGADAVLSGLKLTEDGDRLLARLYAPTAAGAHVQVAIPADLGTLAAAQAVDLLERPRQDAPQPTLTRAGARFRVPPFGLAGVAVRIERAGG